MSDAGEESQGKVGVLLVGLRGATASTFVGGVTAMAAGVVPAEYGVTGLPELNSLPLVGPRALRFGGWDLASGSVADAIGRLSILPAEIHTSVRETTMQITPMPGLRTELDIPRESGHDHMRCVSKFEEGTAMVATDIEAFRRENQLEDVVVIYTGSPPRGGALQLASAKLSQLGRLSSDELNDSIPAGLIYAVGACRANAHFVDFTPSATLECLDLRRLAEDCEVQLAGRDGSTGQTMLKVVIAELLRMRNIHLQSWYSTNVIGNHDGYVLSLPGHGEVKLRDKTDVLGPILGYGDFAHHVSIDFFPPYGDAKESWDAVEARGWLGSSVSLRLNWRGQDSLLAAPLLFDIVRLVHFGAQYRLRGLQEQLGLFFKRPLGREGQSPSQLFRELVFRYQTLLSPGGDTDVSRP